MEWVTSHEPRREVWRRIHEFANEDVALGHIERHHGTDKKQRQNRLKQAKQAPFFRLASTFAPRRRRAL